MDSIYPRNFVALNNYKVFNQLYKTSKIDNISLSNKSFDFDISSNQIKLEVKRCQC